MKKMVPCCGGDWERVLETTELERGLQLERAGMCESSTHTQKPEDSKTRQNLYEQRQLCGGPESQLDEIRIHMEHWESLASR